MKLVLIDPKKYLKVELKLFNRYRDNRYRYSKIYIDYLTHMGTTHRSYPCPKVPHMYRLEG
jgi:predicted transposase YdaD